MLSEFIRLIEPDLHMICEKEELDIERLTRFISYYWMSQYAVSYPRTSKFYDPYFKIHSGKSQVYLFYRKYFVLVGRNEEVRQDDSLRKQGFKTTGVSCLLSSLPMIDKE